MDKGHLTTYLLIVEYLTECAFYLDIKEEGRKDKEIKSS